MLSTRRVSRILWQSFAQDVVAERFAARMLEQPARSWTVMLNAPPVGETASGSTTPCR